MCAGENQLPWCKCETISPIVSVHLVHVSKDYPGANCIISTTITTKIQRYKIYYIAIILYCQYTLHTSYTLGQSLEVTGTPEPLHFSAFQLSSLQ